MSAKMTPFREKALAILRAHGPLRPKAFARLMWPNSPLWKSHTRCGANGVCLGGGMVLAGGGHLGRLRAAGLAIEVRDGYIAAPGAGRSR